MEQLNIIDVITKRLLKEKEIRALFLKGSFARNEVDEYSDIDYYVIVHDEEVESFLNKRIEILQSYRPLIYYSEANFVGPQIVGVYDNGLHIDLYTITLNNLKQSDKIKVLYDPEHLLDNYEEKSLSLSLDEISKNINEFSFTLLEFETAYKRRDILLSSRLVNYLNFYLITLLRYIIDKDFSLLGFKRLYKNLDYKTYEKIKDILDLQGPSHCLECVKSNIKLFDEYLNKLPPNIKGINYEFYNFMKERINNIEGE